jgi:hypothetical protein
MIKSMEELVRCKSRMVDAGSLDAHDNEGLEDSGPFVGDRTDFAALQASRSEPWLRASGRVPHARTPTRSSVRAIAHNTSVLWHGCIAPAGDARTHATPPPPPPPHVQAFYAAGDDNAIFLAKIEEIKASHRYAPRATSHEWRLCACAVSACAVKCAYCCVCACVCLCL